ncbi:hypothetical protein NAB32_18385, partial [Proteus mirabilis]|nr:hypothetical protein [Proteus mirabilis]
GVPRDFKAMVLCFRLLRRDVGVVHTTPTPHPHPHHTLYLIHLYWRCHTLPGFLTEIKKNENEILFFSPTTLLHSPK